MGREKSSELKFSERWIRAWSTVYFQPNNQGIDIKEFLVWPIQGNESARYSFSQVTWREEQLNGTVNSMVRLEGVAKEKY